MTMILDVHVVAKSGNDKTGSIPVTYRPMGTCPTSCPFLPTGSIGGCYGTGRIFSSASKYAGDTDVESATWKIRLGKERSAKYLRDRVVGDVVTPQGTLDRDYIAGIAAVATNNGLVPFGYTHAWRTFTDEDVAFIADTGYVMNASTETEIDVLAALEKGLQPVIVDDDTPEGDSIGGRRVVTCPAETRDDVNCASCGLCAKPNRSVLIRFTIHGTARAKARKAVATAKEAA